MAAKKKTTRKKADKKVVRKAVRNPRRKAASKPRLETEENGRDTKGRFAPGNKGGPGRPSGTVDLRAALDKAKGINVVADSVEVYKALRKAALAGDVAAMREFFLRIVGAVRQEIDMKADTTVAHVDFGQQARSDVLAMIKNPDARAGVLDLLQERTGATTQ